MRHGRPCRFARRIILVAFHDVVPMLGRGKVDLKKVRELELLYTSEPHAQA
jgi:hypothetical protein